MKGDIYGPTPLVAKAANLPRVTPRLSPCHYVAGQVTMADIKWVGGHDGDSLSATTT